MPTSPKPLKQSPFASLRARRCWKVPRSLKKLLTSWSVAFFVMRKEANLMAYFHFEVLWTLMIWGKSWVIDWKYRGIIFLQVAQFILRAEKGFCTLWLALNLETWLTFDHAKYLQGSYNLFKLIKEANFQKKWFVKGPHACENSYFVYRDNQI